MATRVQCRILSNLSRDPPNASVRCACEPLETKVSTLSRRFSSSTLSAGGEEEAPARAK